jgi:hypothetical protein
MNHNLVFLIIGAILVVLFIVTTILLIIARGRAAARAREWKDRYLSEQASWQDKYNERCRKLSRQFESSHVHLMAQALAGKAFQDLEKRVNNQMEKKYQRLKQSVLGNLSDKSDGLIRTIRTSLSTKIWGTFQQYKEPFADLPIIWPRNMRLAYTQGNATVLMLEQEPQVRSIFVSEKLAGRSAGEATDVSGENYTYRLAFPYMYFLVLYLNGSYRSVELYVSNKSIVSLDDPIGDAPLPNVHYNQHIPYICMGNDFPHYLNQRKTFAEQSHFLISEYWQRPFNTDLGRGGYDSVDKRMCNLRTWQKNSEADPTFVLNVKWPKQTTVRAVIERALNHRTAGSLDMASQAIQNELKTCAELVGDTLGKEIENVKLALDETKNTARIREDLEAVVAEHAHKVFAHCITT